MKLIFSLLLVLPVLAADFAGPWKFSYRTSSGITREGKFDLRINGDQVTGTITSDRGTANIESGRIYGNEISFRLIRHSSYDDIEVRYEGKLDGGTLKLTMQYGTHAPIAITATKPS